MEPYHPHTIEQHHAHTVNAPSLHVVEQHHSPEAFDPGSSNNNEVYYSQPPQAAGPSFPSTTQEEGTQFQPLALHVAPEIQPSDGAIVPLKMYPPAEASHAEVFTSRELFYTLLQKFHEHMGIHYRTPRIGGQDLDLYTLYREVTAHGGLEQVINNRRWNKVIKPFQFPKSTTSAAFILRKFYSNTLHHFEQVYFFGASGPPVDPPAPLPNVGGGGGGGGAGNEDKPKRVRKAKLAGVHEPGSRIGQTVTGVVQARFDWGYILQVDANGEKLSGVLYHVPKGPSAMAFVPPGGGVVLGPGGKQRRKRRRRGEKGETGAPKLNRTGYNFYFKQMKHQLKVEHPGVHDRDISRMIGERWNAMTGDDRLPWQQLAEEDKVRYERDMQIYKFNMMTKGAGPAEALQQLQAGMPKVGDGVPDVEGFPEQQEGMVGLGQPPDAPMPHVEQEHAVLAHGGGEQHDDDVAAHGGEQHEDVMEADEHHDAKHEDMMSHGEVEHELNMHPDMAPTPEEPGGASYTQDVVSG